MEIEYGFIDPSCATSPGPQKLAIIRNFTLDHYNVTFTTCTELVNDQYEKQGEYRYGFNGMERDDEVKGIGNSYDFGARLYDPRLGRWFGNDPLGQMFPSHSPLIAFSNNPIIYIDPDGMKWVNAFDKQVEDAEKALIENPDSEELKSKLELARMNQAMVNQMITTLKENDVALYDYIENLKVKDAISGEEIDVLVTVNIKPRYMQIEDEEARTFYSNLDKNDKPRYIVLNTLQDGFPSTHPAPFDVNGKIGFTVEVLSNAEWNDVYLANEAGDVMYRMEYPTYAFEAGSDKGKSINEYLKPGSPGDYSKRVETTYKQRKKSGEGQDATNNPYPLKR